ncbi:unnamed protein product [Sphenostylis stenocarpa]|uniref:Uncharacterized protein n=1 Tax=Sphenostylis stenocarpa TaxID=92480 RepID=A0AA86S9G4_9FABA|nr:unnamed protein product [Sphenostylis stenocarpa]
MFCTRDKVDIDQPSPDLIPFVVTLSCDIRVHLGVINRDMFQSVDPPFRVTHMSLNEGESHEGPKAKERSVK